MVEQLHENDLKILVEAMERGAERYFSGRFPVDQPPTRTGADARGFREAFREMLKGSELREVIRQAVEEGLERREEEFRRMVHEEGIKIFKEEMVKVFEDLDLPIGTVLERRSTRQKLFHLFEMQETAQSWKRDLFSWLLRSGPPWIAAVAATLYAWLISGGKPGGPH